MNKLFATITLVFATVCFSHAQDGYVKFIKDTELKGKKFYKGEIYLLTTSTDTKFPFHFTVGTDTFGVGKSVEKVETNPNDKTILKDNFIKSKAGGLIHIDVSSVSTGNDTIRFVSEKFEVTPIVKNTIIDLEESKVGKSFHLIIPNSPTIYYSLNELTRFTEQQPPLVETDKDGDGINDKKDNCPDDFGTPQNIGCPKKGWAWWIWLLFGLTALVIGYFVWKIFIRRRSRTSTDEYVVFNSNSLTDFAKQYGGLDLLSSINPEGLIPTKSEWNKIKHKDEGYLKIQNLKGKKIRVKEKEKPEFGFGNVNDGRKEAQETNTYSFENPKENYQPQVNSGNLSELSSQLQRMEINITREIQRMSSGFSSSKLIDDAHKEKQDLENKFKGLESEKRKVEEKLTKAELDFNDQNRKLKQAQDDTKRIEEEMKALKERVISLDFLKAYSESVFSYLKYCQQVSVDAYNLFNRISHQNPKQAFALGHLLMKYQSAVNGIPVGNWLQIAEDLKDSGATTNRQLTRSFSQIQSDAEKEIQFKRQLFSQVLTKYSGNILILAEALKNLSRFQGANDYSNEAHNTFGKHVSEILTKARTTGIELKHVSLFESWEQHLGKVEEKGDERSLAYKEINGLEKGAIAEIVSIGVKTTFEDTPTIVIIA